MTTLNELNTEAAALKAANVVKYKAQGYTHRIEMQIFGARGAYVRTLVFYNKGEPNLMVLALKGKSKSLLQSTASAIVEVL